MEASDFGRLFRYDRWANREVLDALRSTAAPPAKSVRWLAHIVAAEALWLARIQRRPQPMPVWPELKIEELPRALETVGGEWEKFLENPALDAACEYTNSKGERFTSSVGDILTHVVTHSTYHRGQIAADMRAAGFEPPYTDFIHAVRQGRIG
jgi:uncharacterized damage-inducible protein DinB